MYTLNRLFLTIVILFSSISAHSNSDDFLVSIGGYEYCQHRHGFSTYVPPCAGQRISLSDILVQSLTDVNSVTIWITRDWQENWYDAQEIQKNFIEQGITPVFLFYWLADDISPSFVHKHKHAYQKDLKRFVRFMDDIPGPKKVILDPEFNQNGIPSWDGYNDFLIENMDIVRTTNNVEVSFCIGDFGIYSKLDDLNNFSSFHTSIARAAQHADFLSFQEMRALTRNSAIDIATTPARTLEFAKHLFSTYNKPTYLAYTAISSYGTNGETLQAGVFSGFADLMPAFRNQAGLIGFGAFHLTDVAHHVGYFLEAEKHFGVLDKNGNPKPAFTGFRRIAEQTRSN